MERGKRRNGREEKRLRAGETGTRTGATTPRMESHFVVRDNVRKRSMKFALAKTMRRSPTAAEAAAWALLRDRRCLGLKFRRQHVIRGFIVDFYCPELRLALEIDGPVHESERQTGYDEERDRALAVAGITVMRVRNDGLSEAGLVSLLEPHLGHSPSPPNPLSTFVERGDGGVRKTPSP